MNGKTESVYDGQTLAGVSQYYICLYLSRLTIAGVFIRVHCSTPVLRC